MGNSIAESELLIPFHDVDSMGIVWHGHYAKYFEIARCRLLEQVGFSYQNMAQSDWGWPVVETRIKYVQPLVFDQRVIVRAELKDWDLRLRVDYEIRDADTRRRHTKGRTVQVAVDRQSRQLVVPVPAPVQNTIQAHVEAD